MDLKFM